MQDQVREKATAPVFSNDGHDPTKFVDMESFNKLKDTSARIIGQVGQKYEMYTNEIKELQRELQMKDNKILMLEEEVEKNQPEEPEEEEEKDEADKLLENFEKLVSGNKSNTPAASAPGGADNSAAAATTTGAAIDSSAKEALTKMFQKTPLKALKNPLKSILSHLQG